MNESIKSNNKLKLLTFVIVALVLIGAWVYSSRGGTQNHTVVVSSGGKDIVAYDVVIQYEPKTARIGEITSLVKDFDVVQKITAPGILSVTAIKLPTTKAGTVFDKTPVLNIPVARTSFASPSITIIKNYANTTTKMVDSNLSVLRQGDEGVQVMLAK